VEEGKKRASPHRGKAISIYIEVSAFERKRKGEARRWQRTNPAPRKKALRDRLEP